ncbi:hypothetical protein LCGC14_1414890 [marine sediment metagenome]|uniref:Uncharacterized protein n=1 Tax=marine sediment metagenome TaxID=412755 RepID=A0A0F9M8M5_9ZZZZ
MSEKKRKALIAVIFGGIGVILLVSWFSRWLNTNGMIGTVVVVAVVMAIIWAEWRLERVRRRTVVEVRKLGGMMKTAFAPEKKGKGRGKGERKRKEIKKAEKKVQASEGSKRSAPKSVKAQPKSTGGQGKDRKGSGKSGGSGEVIEETTTTVTRKYKR